MYVEDIEITYFDSFVVEHVPKEILKFIGHKNIKTNIQERKKISKNLSKCIAAFNYFDKALIVLSATSGGVSIISLTSVIGVPAGIASASFTLVFSSATGIIMKVSEITIN